LKTPRLKRPRARAGAEAPTAAQRLALVLAGGNALGAFEAGAYQTLHDHGLQPDWVVGTSIGAVNGAIIAGNPPERRTEALQEFWSKAAWPAAGGAAVASNELVQAMQRFAGQLQTASFGNSAMFVPSFLGLAANGAGTVGLYDLSPLRSTLEQLVDFDLLNTGTVRLTVVAVDLETGDEVLFDTKTDRLGPEHIMASNALLPDFRPIEIEGYLYGDGGLVSNLPVDVVRREPDEDRLCVAIELFSAPRQRCTTFAEAVARRQELLFVNQSRWFLEAYAREDRVRNTLRAVLDLVPKELRDRPEVRAALVEADRPDMRLVTIGGDPGPEVGSWFYDYSEQAIMRRWDAGASKARDALTALQGAPASNQATSTTR
jgi:NTE family protein